MLPALLIAAVPALPFVKYQLDNGLTVILHRDGRTPLVAVHVSYDVGSLHERRDRSGFAHLFEHMMFQKSAHVGEDRFFQILTERGATEINGTTNFDHTVYFETVPSHELELALWAESDRMGFLLAALDQKALDNQKQVVRSERRQNVVDRPYGLIDELVVRRVFPEPHPYHGNVIGIPETIEAATLDDIREFFATFYTPANARLTLAGDFDPARARALIAKYFGTLTGRPHPELTDVPPPELSREILVCARKNRSRSGRA
jgi:zinc protease